MPGTTTGAGGSSGGPAGTGGAAPPGRRWRCAPRRRHGDGWLRLQRPDRHGAVVDQRGGRGRCRAAPPPATVDPLAAAHGKATLAQPWRGDATPRAWRHVHGAASLSGARGTIARARHSQPRAAFDTLPASSGAGGSVKQLAFVVGLMTALAVGPPAAILRSVVWAQGAARDQGGALTAGPAELPKSTFEKKFAGSYAELSTYVGIGDLLRGRLSQPVRVERASISSRSTTSTPSAT